MKKFKYILIAIGIIFFTSGFVSNYFEITKQLEIFNNIYKEINTYYVDPIDPGELMHSTIDTMLKRLDPYTQYIPESEIEDFRFQTTGEYGGIGATIRKIDDFVVIYEPYQNFPADKAGLKMGDILIKIDENELKNPNTEDVSNLLKGTPGTVVNVEIKRNNTFQSIEITREKIQVPSVRYAGILDNSIGYIKLRRFTKNCTKEVSDALNDLEKKTQLKGLILDLRSNPGGLLNESINLSNLFISKNETIVTTNGKNLDWKKQYVTKKEPTHSDLPLVVLVNGASASASEIVAGAIQDLDRGIVVGNKTFGKGLVQQSRKLNYNSRLKVTVAKYYTPSGRCIQDVNQTKKYNDYLEKENDTIQKKQEKKFYTRSGRIVYEGGGIDPDINIKPIEYPNVLISLIQKNYIFKYGNIISADFANYGSIDNFTIPDETYNNFINYLELENFDYNNESDEIIEIIESSLETLSDKNVNLEDMYLDLDLVKIDIDKKKKNSLIKHEAIIKERLISNLITRNFYEEGRIENELKNDPYVERAVEILSDTEAYLNMLSP